MNNVFIASNNISQNIVIFLHAFFKKSYLLKHY